MVRTKAGDNSRKAVGAKMPRKALSSRSSGSTSSCLTSPKGGKYSGGNPVCDRPTPEWQKDISAFFSKNQGQEKENESPKEEGESSNRAGISHENSSPSSPEKPSPPKKGKKSKQKKCVIESDSEGE